MAGLRRRISPPRLPILRGVAAGFDDRYSVLDPVDPFVDDIGVNVSGSMLSGPHPVLFFWPRL